MKHCVIFCAGNFDGLLAPLEKDDYLIGADGGLLHLTALGFVPHHVLGDFDSLGYVPAGASAFPVEKDDTDTMLAVRHGLERNYKQFLLYGSLDGKRLDHTVANFQTLAFLADRGARGYLIGKDYIVTVIKNGSLSFRSGVTGTVSVFCMGQDAEGVTLEGLKYPMNNGTLSAGFPLGVSNRFTGGPARISVENGSLLVLFPRESHGDCEDLL